MKISWVILTYGRWETANKSYYHNLRKCGPIALDFNPKIEIIHVDNGSRAHDQFMLGGNISIRNGTNLGVARGYNQGLVMATGDYIVITGCDRLMPKNWLSTWLEYFERIPNTGIISCYTKPIEQVPERRTGPTSILSYIPAIPMEARILKRDLFKKIGYYHEGLGLYGWEDVLWSERAEKVTKELGLINYIIPGQIAEHLGDEGVAEWKGFDEKDYHEFKKRQANDPKKTLICQEYRSAGHPYINPFL